MATPATPSRLIVNVVSSTALDVYWSSSGANTAFYCIERGPTGGPYTEIARVPVSQTGYHDLGLTAGTQYCYKVRGFDGAATYGLYVGETCATTKGVTTDHAVARFDGTTYVLQNSLAILDDTGNLTTPGTIASKPAAGGIQLDPNAATGNFILSLSPANLTGNQRVTFGNVTGTAALGAGTLTNATVNDVTVAAHTHAITGTFPASAHNLFSTTHGDTTGAASPVDGDMIIGNVTPAWSKLAISIPAANVRNVLGIDNGELRPSWKTALDANNPTTIAPSDAAASGTSLVFSHRDHQHASPATWPATAHALLSATHSDTVASGVARGDLIVGVAGPSWDNLTLGGAAGSFLTRDANDVLWSGFYLTGTPGNTYDLDAGGGAHNLLSATHTDTVAQAVSRGSLVYGDSTPAWNELVIGGAAGSVLTRDANDVLWSGYYLSGTAGGTTTFAVTNTKTLTLTATDSYNLTIPATGTAVLGTGADTRIAYWTGANTVGGDADLTWDAATGILTVNRDHATEQAQIILRNNVGGGRIRSVLSGEIEFASLDGLTTWGSVFASGVWSSGGRFLGDNGTLNIQGIASGKVLFLSCADTYTLTVPATGTAALLGTANVFTAGNTMNALLTVNANIQFPAVQVPDAGANVLDDYEEQTWTPALKFGGASVGMTYGTQTGHYTKIGRLVFVLVSITLTAKGSSVGAATITGLPFTVGGANSSCAVYCAAVANLTSTVIGRPNGTSILLYDTGATGNTPLDDTNFGDISVLNIGAVFSV